MRRLALLGAICGLSVTPAGAWSIGKIPDHKVDYGVCEARKLADYVNNMWADYNDREDGEDRFVTWDNFDIYTENYGKIGNLTAKKHSGKALPSHQYDFVEDLRMSGGKEDEGAITAHRLVRLVKDKKQPVYIFQFQRKQWTQYYIIPEDRAYAAYELTPSTWLLQFSGNNIELLREADELAPLAQKGRNLLDRTPDCAALERAREDD